MENCEKFSNRNDNKPDIDNDFIRGHRLTDKESNALLFEDIDFDEDEFNKVVRAFVKWK